MRFGVASTEALPGTDRSSIKQTEWTYALMMHFSTALGVNCTYCHNSRIFASWEQSSPAPRDRLVWHQDGSRSERGLFEEPCRNLPGEPARAFGRCPQDQLHHLSSGRIQTTSRRQ